MPLWRVYMRQRPPPPLRGRGQVIFNLCLSLSADLLTKYKEHSRIQWFRQLFDSSSPYARGWFYPSILFRCILEVFMKGTMVLHVLWLQMVLSHHLLRHLLGALYFLWIGLFPVPRHFKPVALCLWALTL